MEAAVRKEAGGDEKQLFVILGLNVLPMQIRPDWAKLTKFVRQ